MKEKIINATIEALKSIQQTRFFETERGYQGVFYCELRTRLASNFSLNNDVILEMEYQKSHRHGIEKNQRPDIILHIPAELHGRSIRDDNFAVWALKHRASSAEALDDFEKLKEMFDQLHYPLGFFINVDSTKHQLEHYTGDFPDRIHTFAVKLIGGEVSIIHASLVENEICEEQI
jgi:hypothetical protein